MDKICNTCDGFSAQFFTSRNIIFCNIINGKAICWIQRVKSWLQQPHFLPFFQQGSDQILRFCRQPVTLFRMTIEKKHRIQLLFSFERQLVLAALPLSATDYAFIFCTKHESEWDSIYDDCPVKRIDKIQMVYSVSFYERTYITKKVFRSYSWQNQFSNKH